MNLLVSNIKRMGPGNREEEHFEGEPGYAVRIAFLLQLIILPVCLIIGLSLLWTAAWLWGIILLAFCSLIVLRAVKGIVCARRC